MTLIETNFSAPRRETASHAPRALVTLQHNSDRRSVEAALQRAGYSVRSTNDLGAAEVLVRSFQPDLLIADAREAFPSVRPLMAQARRFPNVYVILVGADSAEQRVTLFRNGADDAVPSDISPDEVSLRCQAMMRRPRRITEIEAEQPRTLNFGPLSIDMGRREIRMNNHVVCATRLEYDLFVQLCQRPLEVCSRSQLLESVWGPNWVGDTHVVDVHLSNLRRKLNAKAPALNFMHTVRGIGFRLHDDLLNLASRDLADQLLQAQPA